MPQITKDRWSVKALNKGRLALHLAYKQPLRDMVARDCPEHWQQYLHYTTTKSKFCPLVYETCDRIITVLFQNGREKEYTDLLDGFEGAS